MRWMGAEMASPDQVRNWETAVALQRGSKPWLPRPGVYLTVHAEPTDEALQLYGYHAGMDGEVVRDPEPSPDSVSGERMERALEAFQQGQQMVSVEVTGLNEATIWERRTELGAYLFRVVTRGKAMG